MACLRKYLNGSYVIRKNKRLIMRAIENKIKLMFTVLLCNSTQVFVSKPTDTFQLIFDQQSCINSNFQFISVCFTSSKLNQSVY